MFLGQSSVLGAKKLWKIKVLDKCLFFSWQVLLRCCWTSERLQRHGMQTYGPCAICSQEEECLDHLILNCVYNREFWYLILPSVGWSHIAPAATKTFIYWWVGSHKRISKECGKVFDSIVILAVWCLWVQRNDKVFGIGGEVSCGSLVFWNHCDTWDRASLVDRSLLLVELASDRGHVGIVPVLVF
jgi:hypothetical protein